MPDFFRTGDIRPKTMFVPSEVEIMAGKTTVACEWCEVPLPAHDHTKCSRPVGDIELMSKEVWDAAQER